MGRTKRSVFLGFLLTTVIALCAALLMGMLPFGPDLRGAFLSTTRRLKEQQDPPPAVQQELVQELDAHDGEDDDLLILVNAQHPMSEEYAPLELEKVQDDYQMDARAAGPMRQMIADAREQGVELKLCSAYRTRARQQVNFQNSVRNYMTMGYSEEQSVMATARLIAEPGTSEHETGLAADIVTPDYQGLDEGYADTAAAKWLLENAASYGFILRYPADKTEITGIDFEPWHYRYVGARAAQEIMAQGLCLEEYVSLRDQDA